MAKARALPAEIAVLAGHNDGGALVARRYQHLFPGAVEAAASRLDDLIDVYLAASVRDDDGEDAP